jgi:hypothetical protein
MLAGLAGALMLAGCGAEKNALSDDYGKAADTLIAKLGGGATIPPANDPAVKAYDEEAGKAMAAVGTPTLPASGFDTFDHLCGKSTTIIQAYVNAGVPAGADPAARAQAMNANAEKYLDQMFTPLLFSAHCTAAHLPFIEGTMSDRDVAQKASAIQQVRGGAWGQAVGLLQMAGASDLDAARKKRIMDLLAGDAANFAIVFTPAQRQQLAEGARQVKPSLPAETQGEADKVAGDIEKAPCGRLCKA